MGKAEDKKVIRLIEYKDATKHYRLVGYINDEPSNRYLSFLQMLTLMGRKRELLAALVDTLYLKDPIPTIMA